MKISCEDKALFIELFTRRENGRIMRGYVLDFSDRTFKEFFISTIHYDVFKRYSKEGSKARKLGAFLVREDLSRSLKVLKALFKRIEDLNLECDLELLKKGQERLNYYENACRKSKPQKGKTKKCLEIIKKLDEIDKNADLQKRGYAFEAFLNYYFKEERLKPREPFKINGQ